MRTAIWPMVEAGEARGAADGLAAEKPWIPKARPLSDEAVDEDGGVWASLSSSLKNSWNSSMIRSIRGIGGVTSPES
jgi:hypothetical protein